ncbi:MAG: 50S ribosomal protein L4 [Parcubacteria group bacterium]|nr:50S ribosomal protein L4 [Parcubacteria group bacterium]
MEAKLYNQNGQAAGSVSLPERIFGVPWNADLVHEAVVSAASNARPAVAHTKDRSEVRGGGKKPWRQKGTGRARHGSIRSPLWRGGGTTFGPRAERSFTKKMNRAAKLRALFTVLAEKMRRGEMSFLESLTLSEPKTRAARTALHGAVKHADGDGLLKKRHAVLFVLPAVSEPVRRGFRNIPHAALVSASMLTAGTILQYKHIVIVDPEKSFEALSSRA